MQGPEEFTKHFKEFNGLSAHAARLQWNPEGLLYCKCVYKSSLYYTWNESGRIPGLWWWTLRLRPQFHSIWLGGKRERSDCGSLLLPDPPLSSSEESLYVRAGLHHGAWSRTMEDGLFSWPNFMVQPNIGDNWQLVTNESVEFEKWTGWSSRLHKNCRSF